MSGTCAIRPLRAPIFSLKPRYHGHGHVLDRHSLVAPPVLFTKTLLRAATRKSLVRLESVADGDGFLACAQDNAIEVLRDTGNDLEILFEECVFDTVWALQALPLDHIPRCDGDLPAAQPGDIFVKVPFPVGCACGHCASPSLAPIRSCNSTSRLMLTDT